MAKDQFIKLLVAPTVAVLLSSTIVTSPAEAQYYYTRVRDRFGSTRHKVRSAVIGGALGAGAGALTGLVAGTRVGRGALIGAGTGAGVGLVRSSRTMRRHPIIRTTATGTLIGLGAGSIIGDRNRYGHRRHRISGLGGAGIGAAIGAGVGLLRYY